MAAKKSLLKGDPLAGAGESAGPSVLDGILDRNRERAGRPAPTVGNPDKHPDTDPGDSNSSPARDTSDETTTSVSDTGILFNQTTDNPTDSSAGSTTTRTTDHQKDIPTDRHADISTSSLVDNSIKGSLDAGLSAGEEPFPRPPAIVQPSTMQPPAAQKDATSRGITQADIVQMAEEMDRASMMETVMFSARLPASVVDDFEDVLIQLNRGRRGKGKITKQALAQALIVAGLQALAQEKGSA